MATDYNRDRDARARSYDPNTYVSMAIGIAVVAAIIAMLAFAVMDRTPTGPNTVTSTPPNPTTTTQPRTTTQENGKQAPNIAPSPSPPTK